MSGKVVIDHDECIGCGSCQEICPEVFKLNAEIEKSEVIKPEGGPEGLITEIAASLIPKASITLFFIDLRDGIVLHNW